MPLKKLTFLITACALVTQAYAAPVSAPTEKVEDIFSLAVTPEGFLALGELQVATSTSASATLPHPLSQVAVPGTSPVLKPPFARTVPTQDHAFLTGALAYAPEPQCVTPQLELPGALLGELVKTSQSQQGQYMTYMQNKFGVPVDLSRRIVSSAFTEAQSTGLSPQLLLAVMERESGFQPKVRSSAGAVGLMQVMGKFHSHKLERPGMDLTHPETNIKLGALVLKEYLEKTGGNLQKALFGYSGGAKTYAGRVLSTYQELKNKIFGPGTSSRNQER